MKPVREETDEFDKAAETVKKAAENIREYDRKFPYRPKRITNRAPTKAQQENRLIALTLGGIALTGLVGAGALVIGIGALAGWGVMVGLLSFAPWLAIAAAVGGAALAGAAIYAGVRLVKQRQQLKLANSLKQEPLAYPKVATGGTEENTSLLTHANRTMSGLFSSCCRKAKAAAVTAKKVP